MESLSELNIVEFNVKMIFNVKKFGFTGVQCSGIMGGFGAELCGLCRP